MKTYTVTVNFGGFIGCEQTYEVYAENRDEAEELALEEARDDLEVIEMCIDEESEDEDYE